MEYKGIWTNLDGYHVKSLGSQISSMTLASNHEFLLTTTLGGLHAPQAHFIWLDGSGLDLDSRDMRYGTIWCSACSPLNSNGYQAFAIGTESQLIIIGMKPDGPRRITRLEASKKHDQRDVHAVDWLDTNVAMSGLRNGKVFLWDIRAAGVSAMTHRITHGSSICHTRALSGNKIVVSGMKNKVRCSHSRFGIHQPSTINVCSLPSKIPQIQNKKIH